MGYLILSVLGVALAVPVGLFTWVYVSWQYGDAIAESRKRVADYEREERGLLEVLETISSSLDLHRVCLTIVSKITRVIPALRCSMLFVDPSAKRCFVIASNDNPNLKMLEVDLQKYPEVRQAIETRNPVLVQNAPDDPIMAEVRVAPIRLSVNVFQLSEPCDAASTSPPMTPNAAASVAVA